VILQLAVFAGMRPGELLAIQREHVKPDASVIEIRRRVYRGSSRLQRTVWSVQSRSLPRLPLCFANGWRRQWIRIPKRTCLRARPANRSGGLPCSKITSGPSWNRSAWAGELPVMRRTHASLGHRAKVDPKVSADQRGHGIGVALDVYTKSSIEDRATAVKQLEDSVLTSAVRARKRSA